MVRDALRQAEQREAKLAVLRKHVAHAIEQGGNYSDDDIAAILAADA
ncbi:MAG: hypothetical protein V7K14_14455 [Nostoc sp.]